MTERDELVDMSRLASNLGTERYQDHSGQTHSPGALDPHGAVGVLSIIERGPTGVGAVYRWTDVGPDGRPHEVLGPSPMVQRSGAVPMQQRAVGA